MENYFNMNLTKQDIDAISNLGLAHMGDCVLKFCAGATSAPEAEKMWATSTGTPSTW